MIIDFNTDIGEAMKMLLVYTSRVGIFGLSINDWITLIFGLVFGVMFTTSISRVLFGGRVQFSSGDPIGTAGEVPIEEIPVADGGHRDYSKQDMITSAADEWERSRKYNDNY